MRSLLLVCIVWLLIGCTVNTTEPPAPTMTALLTPTLTVVSHIDAQEARRIAIDYVTIAQPEVSAAKVPPVPTQIEQLTFAAALDRLGGGGVVVGNDPHMLVWLVTLLGRWEDGFPHPKPPPPTPMPTPVSYYQRRVVINAQTGVVMASQ